MLVYRISSAKYIGDLSGNGSKLYGGRWNDKGTSMVYFASTRAMAVLELLVHLAPDDLVKDYVLAVFDVPDDKILAVKIAELPENWQETENANYLRKLGKKFIDDCKCLLMKIPSALVDEENNFVMNPLHKDANKVKLISQRVFNFDRRFKD